MFLRETELTRFLCVPDERIRIGRYLIMEQVGRGLSGIWWIGLYGSFWNYSTCSPNDIDLAIDLNPNSLLTFERKIGGSLIRNFGLTVDLFPTFQVEEQYGVQKVQELIRASETIYGNVPST